MIVELIKMVQYDSPFSWKHDIIKYCPKYLVIVLYCGPIHWSWVMLSPTKSNVLSIGEQGLQPKEVIRIWVKIYLLTMLDLASQKPQPLTRVGVCVRVRKSWPLPYPPDPYPWPLEGWPTLVHCLQDALLRLRGVTNSFSYIHESHTDTYIILRRSLDHTGQF